MFIDDDGQSTYYWHVKSGSIQRDAPKLSTTESSYSIHRSISTNSQVLLEGWDSNLLPLSPAIVYIDLFPLTVMY